MNFYNLSFRKGCKVEFSDEELLPKWEDCRNAVYSEIMSNNILP
jgi:hypothetical protein